MSLEDKKYNTLKIKGTWNAPSQEEENILALKMEIENLKQVWKETPSDPPGNPKIQPSVKKKRPKWLLLNKTPSNVNESRQWNDHTWCYFCNKKGGKFNGK